MFRAVRYEQRFGFCIDDGTLRAMASTVDSGHMESVSGERWLHEIERILEEGDPGRTLLRSAQLGLLSGLHPALSSIDGIIELAKCAEGHAARPAPPVPAPSFDKLRSGAPLLEEWLAALFSPLSEADGRAVIQRLRLSGHRAAVARDTIAIREKEKEIRGAAIRSSNLFRVLRPFSPQAIAIRSKMSDDPVVRHALARYLNKLRFVRTSLTGEDLLEMGAAQGPLIGEILALLHDARLDGRLSDGEDERVLARELLAHSQEGAAR